MSEANESSVMESSESAHDEPMSEEFKPVVKPKSAAKSKKKRKVVASEPKQHGKSSVKRSGKDGKKKAKAKAVAPRTTKKSKKSSSKTRTKKGNSISTSRKGSTGTGTGRKIKALPKGQHAPTRKGKPFYSGWKSRVHGRVQSDRKSSILCQRNSRSKIWKRDAVSVPPGREKEVTCGRCRLAIASR